MSMHTVQVYDQVILSKVHLQIREYLNSWNSHSEPAILHEARTWSNKRDQIMTLVRKRAEIQLNPPTGIHGALTFDVNNWSWKANRIAPIVHCDSPCLGPVERVCKICAGKTERGNRPRNRCNLQSPSKSTRQAEEFTQYTCRKQRLEEGLSFFSTHGSGTSSEFSITSPRVCDQPRNFRKKFFTKHVDEFFPTQLKFEMPQFLTFISIFRRIGVFSFVAESKMASDSVRKTGSARNWVEGSDKATNLS